MIGPRESGFMGLWTGCSQSVSIISYGGNSVTCFQAKVMPANSSLCEQTSSSGEPLQNSVILAEPQASVPSQSEPKSEVDKNSWKAEGDGREKERKNNLQILVPKLPRNSWVFLGFLRTTLQFSGGGGSRYTWGVEYNSKIPTQYFGGIFLIRVYLNALPNLVAFSPLKKRKSIMLISFLQCNSKERSGLNPLILIDLTLFRIALIDYLYSFKLATVKISVMDRECSLPFVFGGL